MEEVLVIENLSKFFGGLGAVQNISLTVHKEGLYGIIGPNGAGKTTLFNVIYGLYKPTTGEIKFNGECINGFAPEKIVQKGMARTFQNLRIFHDMTALENVWVAAETSRSKNLPLRLPFSRKLEKLAMERAEQILDLCGLWESAFVKAGSLPYGKLKILEIARALATNPSLLLLDEPVAGLNDVEVIAVAELLRKLKSQHITCLIVEHNMDLVMQECDRVAVLNFGQLIAEGNPEIIQSDAKVIEAYLGNEESGH